MSRATYGAGRQALIEATVQVIGDHGWAGLTNRRVAEVAGVNNTLITHHFGSQETLISAAADWAVATSIRRADLAVAGRLDDDFADALLLLVDVDPSLQAFQLELILAARRDDTLRPVATRLYSSYLESARLLLERTYGLPSDPDLARALFAALEGLVLQLLTVVPPESIRDSIRSLDRVLVAYASSNSAPGPVSTT